MVRLAKRDSAPSCTDGAKAKGPADSNPRAQVGDPVARPLQKAPYIFTSSTRRLFWRPSGVSFDVTGFVAPSPLATRRAPSIEYLSIRYCRTAAARFSES